MGIRWTTETVLAWIQENRPTFVPDKNWEYKGVCTPIQGLCTVCGSPASPRFDNMKGGGRGSCNTCAKTASSTKNTEAALERYRVTVEKSGYTLLAVEYRETFNGADGRFLNRAWLHLACDTRHDPWWVAAHSFHTNSRRCPSCAEFGFKDDKSGSLYLLARNLEGLEQRGFGISNDVVTRIKGYERFGWLAIDIIDGGGGEVRAMETAIIQSLKPIGKTVERDHIKYRNTEAWSDGYGVPMFNTVKELVKWSQYGKR